MTRSQGITWRHVVQGLALVAQVVLVLVGCVVTVACAMLGLARR